jgi:hypothetical protein
MYAGNVARIFAVLNIRHLYLSMTFMTFPGIIGNVEIQPVEKSSVGAPYVAKLL